MAAQGYATTAPPHAHAQEDDPQGEEARPSAPPRVVTVCHPVYRLETGGLEQQLLQTAARLPQERFRHIIVIRNWDGRTSLPTDQLGANTTVVRETRPERDPQWPYRLAAILRDHAVDVLHIRGLTMLMDSLMAGHLCGDVRIAFSFHGLEEVSKHIGTLRRGILQAAIARCDARWAVSRKAAEALGDMLKMSSKDFDILANGVDVDHFVPATSKQKIRTQLSLPSAGPIVLSVGNLKPVKGHDVLLEAIHRLPADLRHVTFVLVGQDYLHGVLQRWVAKHLPDTDIRFVGHQADMLPWYQAADLFVLPSLWEGHSNALLEAMSCGLPVVATEVGGNRETVQQDTTGLRVPPGDPDALASAMAVLLDDPARCASFGDAGRQQAVRKLNLATSIKRYGAYYERLARRASQDRAQPR